MEITVLKFGVNCIINYRNPVFLSSKLSFFSGKVK